MSRDKAGSEDLTLPDGFSSASKLPNWNQISRQIAARRERLEGGANGGGELSVSWITYSNSLQPEGHRKTCHGGHCQKNNSPFPQRLETNGRASPGTGHTSQQSHLILRAHASSPPQEVPPHWHHPDGFPTPSHLFLCAQPTAHMQGALPSYWTAGSPPAQALGGLVSTSPPFFLAQTPILIYPANSYSSFKLQVSLALLCYLCILSLLSSINYSIK